MQCRTPLELLTGGDLFDRLDLNRVVLCDTPAECPVTHTEVWDSDGGTGGRTDGWMDGEMDHGSWEMDPGSWILGDEPWEMDPGRWILRMRGRSDVM